MASFQISSSVLKSINANNQSYFLCANLPGAPLQGLSSVNMYNNSAIFDTYCQSLQFNSNKTLNLNSSDLGIGFVFDNLLTLSSSDLLSWTCGTSNASYNEDCSLPFYDASTGGTNLPSTCTLQLNSNTSSNNNALSLVLLLDTNNVFNIYAPTDSSCSPIDISSVLDINNSMSTLTLIGDDTMTIEKLFMYIPFYQNNGTLQFNIQNNQSNVKVSFLLSNQYNPPYSPPRKGPDEQALDILVERNLKESIESDIPPNSSFANTASNIMSTRQTTTPFIINPSTISTFTILSSTEYIVTIS